jgi:DNA repair protein SbcD/Mre11
LGQKFLNQQHREAEENAALAWLLDAIRAERVDALLLAGDVFDVHNPPIQAERQYYQFLHALKTTTDCRHVVIVGGNHDSPFKLNAPRDLLRAFDIHVVGAAAEDLDGEIIALEDAEGRAEVLVAAIPFLRERDVMLSVPGESVEARLARLRAGIRQHYEAAAERIQARLDAAAEPKPVVVATGHLFATGASAAEEQRNIYLGSQDHIRADEIPQLFDYVALGHIHRGQKVGGQARVRYSGSLIPLSFSEAADHKMVLLIEIEPGRGLVEVREIAVPRARRLLQLSGSLAELEAQLQVAHQADEPLAAWVKIALADDNLPADADQKLREMARDLNLDILRIEIARPRAALDESAAPTESLADMGVQEVFLRRCQSEGLGEEAVAELQMTFAELREWLAQNPERVK